MNNQVFTGMVAALLFFSACGLTGWAVSESNKDKQDKLFNLAKIFVLAAIYYMLRSGMYQLSAILSVLQ